MEVGQILKSNCGGHDWRTSTSRKKHLNLPQQRETYEGKKKKKENEEDGFQEKKKTN